MIKLKIILQSKYLYLFLILITLINIFIRTKYVKYDSIYKDGNITIIGEIVKIDKKDDSISLLLKTKEKIIVKYYLKDNIDLKVGYIIKIIGNIYTPNKNTIKNTFNYKKYLYNNHIYKIINATKIEIISKNINIIKKGKNYILEKAKINPYVNLFITGNKSLLDDEIYNNFKLIGALHLLAISGMHMMIFIKILNYLLKFIKNKVIKHSIIVIFLFYYAYIINFTPSITRAIVFYVINLINKKFNLKLNNLKILILCFFSILIYDPFLIYNTGFQYSFLCVLAIILSKKYQSKNYYLNILIITFFTLLFTLPITINLNYEINLLSFIGNLILIPFITFILYPLSLITFLLPFISNIYNIICLICEKITMILANIKIFNINIPKINIIIIFIYYIFLILFIYYNNKKYLFSIIIMLFSIKLSYKLDSNYYVNYFDVKQGDSSIIISKYHKKIIMIDTGGLVNSNYNISDNVILYLKSIGITKINYLILTHGDFDHMKEAINLVNNFKIEKVIFNCGPYNDLEKELIKVLDKKKIKYYSCIKELNIDKNKLYFLQTKEYDNENDNSNVIYTELNGYKFMFMGDASITTEKEITNKYNLEDIDVLKVGHHGSKTSSGKEFINKINPKYSVISVGKNNRYGHPNKEVLDNLKKSNIYRTDQDGSIIFKIKNNKLRIETCSP